MPTCHLGFDPACSTHVHLGEFLVHDPSLPAVARELIYDNRTIGLGFLATVRPDGGPRVHPICPLVTEDGLFGFIVPGPKRDDLRRDGRFALA